MKSSLLDQRASNLFAPSEFDVRMLGGAGSGNYGHSGRPGAKGGSMSRSERAVQTHAPMTKERMAQALASERKVAKAISGKALKNNEPMDVVVHAKGRVNGIEVKTILAGKNDKITMHPDALARKKTWLRKNKALGHTVAIDTRVNPPQHYYRRGFGSFRLSSMLPVSLLELRKALHGPSTGLRGLIERAQERFAGGAGSGNFNHGGRPGNRGGSVPSNASLLSRLGILSPPKIDVSRELIGALDSYGAVTARNTTEQFNDHTQMGQGMRPAAQRFRVIGNVVQWDDTPSDDAKFAVENWLAKHGKEEDVRHRVFASKMMSAQALELGVLRELGGAGTGVKGGSGPKQKHTKDQVAKALELKQGGASMSAIQKEPSLQEMVETGEIDE